MTILVRSLEGVESGSGVSETWEGPPHTVIASVDQTYRYKYI